MAVARLRVCSIAWALALAACGPAASSNETGAGSSETDSGSTGTETDTDADELPPCIDEDGLLPRVLRLELEPARAHLIDDGAEIDLPLEGDGHPEWLDGSAAGDYIAVARTDKLHSGPNDSKVHVFSRSSGERLWTQDIDGNGVSSLRMSEDGWLSGSVTNDVPGVMVGFVMSEAGVIELPDHYPRAPPTSGWLAACEANENANDPCQGWLDLDDLGWQPVMPPPVSYNNITVAEDHLTFEYLAFIDGAYAFVRARPNGAETIALPFVVEEEWVAIVASNDRYRIVRRYVAWHDPPTADFLRIDVESGELALVESEPPPGWSFYDCENRDAAVDADGRIYFELRNESRAQVWAWDVEDDRWTAVGHSLSLVVDISAQVLQRDLLVVSGSENADFCSDGFWNGPPMDALLGDSRQLVRRELAQPLVFPPYTRLSSDGQQRCLAVNVDDHWWVRALDGSDAVLDFGPGSGDWIWLD